MSNSMQKELSRVRALKRASESEVEYLRSEMEKGNLHIRVSEDESFRQEVAEAIVKMSQPSWSWEYQGGYYADPLGKVYFKESNAPWNPWSDGIDFRIIPADELINQEGNDFDPSVDWQGSDLKEEIIQAWSNSCNATYDWDLAYEWALSQPEWVECIQEAEQEAWDKAVSFAKSEIKDEIVV